MRGDRIVRGPNFGRLPDGVTTDLSGAVRFTRDSSTPLIASSRLRSWC